VLSAQVGALTAEAVELHVQAQHGDVRRNHAREQRRDDPDPEDPTGDPLPALDDTRSRSQRGGGLLGPGGGPGSHQWPCRSHWWMPGSGAPSRPPGRSIEKAEGSAASRAPSSSLTAIRNAWKTRLAGWPSPKRAGAGIAALIVSTRSPVRSNGSSFLRRTIAFAICREYRSSP